MDKKISLIILIIAVLLIIAGGYFILNSNQSIEYDNVTLKTQDFKFFEIETPEKSNFTVKNTADNMIYYQNNGSYAKDFSGIIINKGLTDELIGDNNNVILNTSNEQIYSIDLKNKTVYKIVSVYDDVDIILIGENLNLLKEVSNTTKIKNTNLKIN